MAYLSTIAAFGFEDFHPPTVLAVYQRLGCRASQFYRNPANPPAPAEARRIAADAGVPFDSMHGVFGPEYDPSSPEEPVRRLAIETYRREAELALELGGGRVVVHPAPHIADPAHFTAADRMRRQGPMRQSMEELADIGAEMNVVFLIENIPAINCFGDNVELLGEMIRALGHPNLRMCFDTGHAHMTADVGAALTSVADVVAYVHVHDNDGEHDSHEIPGVQGNLPWEAYARAAAALPDQTPAMLELFQPIDEIERQIEAGLYDRLARWLVLTPDPASPRA